MCHFAVIVVDKLQFFLHLLLIMSAINAKYTLHQNNNTICILYLKCIKYFVFVFEILLQKVFLYLNTC